ncbi:PAS domain S-box protein [Megalodesulfovibrio paquesii]
MANLSKQYRLLLVEDDVVSAKTIAFMLKRLGHDLVEVASSGQQALAAADTHTPDMVLLDIRLDGDMDGLEVANLLRANPATRHIGIMFLTGMEPYEQMENALTIADCFIQKPVKFADLSANLHICIQRRRLESRLAASERRYQELVQDAPVGIYQSRLDGSLVTVNPAFANMLGFASPEEALASNILHAGMPYVDETRREAFMTLLAREGAVRDFESEVYGRDGDIFWIQEQAARTVHAAGETLVEGFVTDITARKDAELERDITMHLLRQTLDALPDPLALLDEQQHLILGNSALRKAIGPARARELASLRFADLLAPRSRKAWATVFSRFAEDGHMRQVRLLLADSAGWYVFTISPYGNPSGERIGAVCQGRFVAPEVMPASVEHAC